MSDSGTFDGRVVRWFRENQRNLPWRKTKDPYQIWLSEIILQQTRVVQGLPYYNAFVQAFPSIHDLANAETTEVLRLWQGLGYYSRARNLHKCAKEVAFKSGGEFPSSFKELLQLPGIGPYTAAAIASLAFNESVGVVDGNVFRVLSRVFAVEDDIGTSKGARVFQDLANQLVSKSHPGEYNQGIMDIGATVCLPQNPKCEECPLALECIARKDKSWSIFPVKAKKTKVKQVHFTYFVFQVEKKLWLKKRGPGIWNSLFDFYLIENKIKSPKKELERIVQGPFEIHNTINIRHLLSHREIHATLIHVTLGSEQLLNADGMSGAFYSLGEIEDLPKPRLIDGYLQDSVFSDSFTNNI